MGMTWEQFEQSGAVEDYLLYRGLERRPAQQSVWPQESYFCRGGMEDGTDDNGDRYGAGRLSLQ